MRELILSTALRLFVDESFQGTTMRRIADEIEYTPGAIYSYFKDKDEICYALHHKGFERLNAMMTESLVGIADPTEQLRAVGAAYIRFAFENRALYDLMFISQKTGKKILEDAEWEPGHRAFGTLRETVQMFIAKHKLDWNVDVTAFGCWSAVHGMVALVLCDRCAPLAAEGQPVDHLTLVHLAYAQYVDAMHTAAQKRGRKVH